MLCLLLVFFFQAEDGIRDIGVTGVQTCALPIFSSLNFASGAEYFLPLLTCFCSHFALVSFFGKVEMKSLRGMPASRTAMIMISFRSEERRVGKECRSRWLP